MYILDKIAQDIVEKTSEIIKFPISIINQDGIIVGSTDTERLGLLHNPKEKMSKKQALKNFLLPGITTPIIINQKKIGVLGIIGEKHEVSEYLYLVKNHVEMMCQGALKEEIDNLQSKMTQSFIQQLINHKPGTDFVWVNGYLDMLGYDLEVDRLCILFELIPYDNTNLETSHNLASLYFQRDLLKYLDHLFGRSKDVIKTFINIEQVLVIIPVISQLNYESINNSLKSNLSKINIFLREKFNLTARMSVGEVEQGIYGITTSFLKAKTAMLSRPNIDILKEEIFYYSDKDSIFQSLYKGLNEPYKERLTRLIRTLTKESDYSLLSSTFLNYCKSDLNVSATARNMFVHRNTIVYRLEKISDLTGFKITNFSDCLTLYLAIITHEEKF